MKASINVDGVLKICPENETEAWALKKWWEGFRPSSPNSSTGICADFKDFENPLLDQGQEDSDRAN